MEKLLQLIKADDYALRKYIIKQTAQELSNLAEPCYYSKTKKFYFDVLLDDKAGFRPDVDWKLIYELFKKYEITNYGLQRLRIYVSR